MRWVLIIVGGLIAVFLLANIVIVVLTALGEEMPEDADASIHGSGAQFARFGAAPKSEL